MPNTREYYDRCTGVLCGEENNYNNNNNKKHPFRNPKGFDDDDIAGGLERVEGGELAGTRRARYRLRPSSAGAR